MSKIVTIPDSNLPTTSPGRGIREPRNKHLVPEGYKNMAKAMEKQFVQHMISQMDKTVGRSEEGSSAKEYYRSLLHDEFAEQISQSDALGIQDIVLDEIYPRNLRNETTYKSHMAQKKNNQVGQQAYHNTTTMEEGKR